MKEILDSIERKILIPTASSADDRYYYSGQKDVQERALCAELALCDDLDRSIVLRAQLAMLLRGQKRWTAARREICRLDSRNLLRASPDSRAFVEAAEGALLLEEGFLSAAIEKLDRALSRFKHSREYSQLRQYVSSLWKCAEIQASLRHTNASRALLARAKSIAIEIGDLHGYCNAQIAEAHIAVSQGRFKAAATALIWASHPPEAIGKEQPHPKFIAGELARAWAVVEWSYRLMKGKWLGYVHPLWALKFADQRLEDSMSYVMRVPFLGELAIASPKELYAVVIEREEMIPLGSGSRARFSQNERERIFSLYAGICALCGKRISEIEKWHVDHIVLHSIGHAPKKTARDAYLNYRPLHSSCNLARGDDDFWYLADAYHNNPTLWVERTWR